jgi:hypothetical protein
MDMLQTIAPIATGGPLKRAEAVDRAAARMPQAAADFYHPETNAARG